MQKFSGLFSIVILLLFPEIIVMHDNQDVLVLFVLLLRFEEVILPVCFKNLFLRLCYVYMLLYDWLSTLNTQQAVWLFVFLVCMSSLAKSKQIIGCTLSDAFSNILFFDVPQDSNRFNYIKDRRWAVYFNNQKITAYHLYSTLKKLIMIIMTVTRTGVCVMIKYT